MTRVYPKANGVAECREGLCSDDDGRKEEEVLTVWRKSLLLNGKGFTVFDGKGDLVFRVDNYASDNKGEIVLMDAVGKPLLTIRRKKLSLGENWLIYEGEETSNPLLSVKKHINLLQPKSLAHVVPCTGGGSACASPSSSPPVAATPSNNNNSSPRGAVARSPKAAASAGYEVEGSYSQRCCAVYDAQRRKLAEIKRKESPTGGAAFGLDVFRLIVQPGFDRVTAMAIVILLEQMFGSKGSLIKKS
ncbi:protein LURP-one-related 8-like [Iris pallida]|uniref:Protein LURP-one-related 8-like n=1 Tax=Iris pallida TaxID=29817 RepID=A0AAX6F4B9_IRIPA|nr:protein LURP-one-related 8-like [Iris pallida]